MHSGGLHTRCFSRDYSLSTKVVINKTTTKLIKNQSRARCYSYGDVYWLSQHGQSLCHWFCPSFLFFIFFPSSSRDNAREDTPSGPIDRPLKLVMLQVSVIEFAFLYELINPWKCRCNQSDLYNCKRNCFLFELTFTKNTSYTWGGWRG